MQERSFDWRLPAVWAVLLTISVFAHAYVEVADSGHRIGFGRAVVQEAASHIMVAVLLPAIYWLHRRFPLGASPRNILIRNILIHALAIVPSTKKVGAPGSTLDVPMTHINASYVRGHFDAMEVRLSDAPRGDEILVALVVTDGGRPHARVGGLTVDEAKKEDGLR